MIRFRFCLFAAIAILWAGVLPAQVLSRAAWTQLAVGVADPAPYIPMAYDAARAQVVLFGAGNFDETWVWDGSNWTQKNPATSPDNCGYSYNEFLTYTGCALAYDAARGQMVLFVGGFQTTWVWDGSNWTKKNPSNRPPARVGFAMAYDAAHSQVVLFGGTWSTGDLADTWVWDGNNWIQKNPTSSPSARSDHAMAYDAASAQTLLFGGIGAAFFGDTWVWDGNNWTQKNPASSPAARLQHAMAYDTASGLVLLFGGRTFGGRRAPIPVPFGDTWEWDGNNWIRKDIQNHPPSQWGHAMAGDSAHGQVVLFGGEPNDVGDTWVWDGAGR